MMKVSVSVSPGCFVFSLWPQDSRQVKGETSAAFVEAQTCHTDNEDILIWLFAFRFFVTKRLYKANIIRIILIKTKQKKNEFAG